MRIRDRFESFVDEYLEFDRIMNKRSARPDLHAFIILDELSPNPGVDIIVAAEHNKFYIDVDLEEIDQSLITDELIIDLVRCGVSYGSEGLYMFA